MEIVLFLISSTALIVIPGPNVLIIVSTSIVHGKKRGLQTVLGTSVAMVIQLIVAMLATTLFIASLSKGLTYLKWLGVIYLLYLASQHFLNLKRDCSQPSISPIGSFNRGFWVSLTNPKTILFFGAFIPQFIDKNLPYFGQTLFYSAVFWLLALFFDSLYAILAAKLKTILLGRNLHKFENAVGGTALTGAALALATTKLGQN